MPSKTSDSLPKLRSPKLSPNQRLTLLLTVVGLILACLAIFANMISAITSGHDWFQSPEISTMTAMSPIANTQVVFIMNASQPTATPHMLLPQCGHEVVDLPTSQIQAANLLTPIPVVTFASFQAIRITIPKLGVDAPIVEGDGWEQLKKGIGHHIDSAEPGSSGNVVLVGHNDSWGELFRELNELTVDDQIIIWDGAERQYIYTITKIETVDETMVSILDKTTAPILTLITCHPYMDNAKRLIITAKLYR